MFTHLLEGHFRSPRPRKQTLHYGGWGEAVFPAAAVLKVVSSVDPYPFLVYFC